MPLSDCAVISGYTQNCRDSIGGIKAVALVELSAKSTFTYASGAATAFTLNTGKKVYPFALEQATATASDDPKPNAANGTLYYEHKLNFMIPKRSASFSYYLKNLAQNDLIAVITTNDETPQYWVLGATNGLKMVDGSTAPFGTALADMNGYNLQFVANEPIMAIQISANIYTTLLSPA
jgi:hypothetical protein